MSTPSAGSTTRVGVPGRMPMLLPVLLCLLWASAPIFGAVRFTDARIDAVISNEFDFDQRGEFETDDTGTRYTLVALL